MELSIKDRLYIPGFLPKENNFKQFNIKKEILKKIEISEEERATVNLRQNTEKNGRENQRYVSRGNAICKRKNRACKKCRADI